MNAMTTIATAINWVSAVEAYLAAKHAEDQHDVEQIEPLLKQLEDGSCLADIGDVPAEAWDRSELLGDLRGAAEDVVMAIPSPTPEAFALKFLIAKGDGRETDCWDDMLENEARRFAPEWACPA